MRRVSLLAVLACVAPGALAEDAGRGKASDTYQTSSADMHGLESAAKVAVWPMVGGMGNPSSPPAAASESARVTPGPKPGVDGACDIRIDAEALKALVWKDAKTVGVDPQLALTILSLESNDGHALNSDRAPAARCSSFPQPPPATGSPTFAIPNRMSAAAYCF